ncbi:MAG: 3-phosphoshikimate 1-carboxyvinyltransferase [Eubacteriales bacterium]|nr:3-phosphoshikimate 1-carboxyvinyltransferase [Eubacteriales bacterium]
MIKIKIPGDKSISHRAVMLGSIAEGTTEIDGFLTGADCLSTISCFQQLGVNIQRDGEKVTVHGVGLQGLKEPDSVLDVGNSGTTIRLISGILAGQNFTSLLTGDSSIRRRPMKRVLDPLGKMGAEVLGRDNNNKAPFAIKGKELESISYKTPVASAQIKSAVLLAGLYSKGTTTVIEPEKSRNHTEVMLKGFGAEIEEGPNFSSVKGFPKLMGQKITVPGDISSAAFFIAGALILPDKEVCIENVGLNETRTGIIDVFREMGGDIQIINERYTSGEKVGDIIVKSSKLKGITFGGEIIPRLVDEIPVIAVAATQAEGVTIIHGAEELKVKESDRLKTISKELSKMGADIEETDDGLIIKGGTPLKYADCESYDDHRIAMSCAIAGLVSDGGVSIDDLSCVDISFPGFFETINSLIAG